MNVLHFLVGWKFNDSVVEIKFSVWISDTCSEFFDTSFFLEFDLWGSG